MLDADWLESLYEPSELLVGKTISLPWRAKGGIQHWKAVIIRPEDQLSKESTRSAAACINEQRKRYSTYTNHSVSVALFPVSTAQLFSHDIYNVQKKSWGVV